MSTFLTCQVKRISIGAGLPNITGQLWTGDVGDSGKYVNGLNTDDEGGIFYKGELVNGYNEGGGAKNYVPKYDFSRASFIYGKSSTVTPLSQSTLYVVKY